MATEYTLRSRLEKLREVVDDLPKELTRLSKGGTIRAVEKATELTPPIEGRLSGTNTQTGEMKQHWATDSKVNPKITGGNYETELKNNKRYASFVNDGYPMDRHFVPGLVINKDSGLLEYNPNGTGGIIVGTKTSYVEGLFMVDKAAKVYKKTIAKEVDKLIKEIDR
jgi:hypothetical protein